MNTGGFELSIRALGCRLCQTPLRHTFANLGASPLANSYLSEYDLQQTEPFYPLHAYVCEKCFLVQLPESKSPREIFTQYAYFSSYSDSWLMHAERYCQEMIERFRFSSDTQIVEVGSNDGYLLRYFKERGLDVLGIDPAQNVAQVAEAAGIPTIVDFFGRDLAADLLSKHKHADLLVANNVLSQTPGLHDFVKGLDMLLSPQGIVTLEFPHLMRLMDGNQFDTIYHEHFSYFSFTTIENLLAAHDLVIFDVEELSTHGGSLRIYARHANDSTKSVSHRVYEFKARELDYGLSDLQTYKAFAKKIQETKRNALEFLLRLKAEGSSIAGYGAPAKANTFLNYCGIGTDFLDYSVDRSPHKQNRVMPGTHIPIYGLEHISRTKPDYLLILAWNLKDEVMEQMSYIRNWGGRFLVLIPAPEVLA